MSEGRYPPHGHIPQQQYAGDSYHGQPYAPHPMPPGSSSRSSRQHAYAQPPQVARHDMQGHAAQYAGFSTQYASHGRPTSPPQQQMGYPQGGTRPRSSSITMSQAPPSHLMGPQRSATPAIHSHHHRSHSHAHHPSPLHDMAQRGHPPPLPYPLPHAQSPSSPPAPGSSGHVYAQGSVPNSQYPASPQRPFPCDMCALSFNRQHDLKRHKETHSGERPFLCNGGCGKTFTRKDALKRHQLVKGCGTSED